ncbi:MULTISPECIES: lipopolysaccharide biosynthesis protein [Aeromonas]|uniref:lipopolysaccharide biosynthesis protein n=1 Tax=Aeromonas TaxID=642 RepID=UPI0029DD3BD2|nr:oligosaccharide flippase family protein [Aeromonas caviae]MDX7850458.1 oligosaccharide flippase family protein [Aeromonas caviae]
MSLAKSSLVYLISNIINALIPFLLLPILTRLLSPAEYGQVAMFQILVAGLAAFVGLNTVGAANRKFYEHNNSLKALGLYNGACLQILLGSMIIVFILCVLFSELLVSYLSIPVNWIYSAVLLSSFNFILNLRLGQWQIRGEAIKFGALQISNSLFNMGLSLLLVLSLHHGAQGRIDAQIIAAGLSTVVAVYLLMKDGLVHLYSLRVDYIKQALQFGIPLIPHVFGFFLLSAIDRFVINQKLGLGHAGIYMVAVQLSMAFNIVFDALNKAYVPWLFEILKHDEMAEKRRVVNYTYLYFIFLLAIAPIPFLIGPWALCFIAGEEFRKAGEIIGWLCLGQIFGGMYLMVTNYIFYAKKNSGLSLITITSGIINVGLLLLLVNSFGLIGAAWAFAITKFIQFISTWLYSSFVLAMPWLPQGGKL